MAFVEYFDAAGSPAFACSGTVISPNLVLTAGHCGVDETTGLPLDPSGFSVVTGSVDRTNAALRRVSEVSRVIVYPAFNAATLTADAALLQLAKPTTAPAVRVGTPNDSQLYNGGAPALIAGWGITSDGSLPFVLQWASTTVQGAAYCGQFFSSFSAFWETCAVQVPGFGSATCNGDSGGPLIAGDATGLPVEVGITSYGPSDCNTTTADVFTRSDEIASWAGNWIGATSPPVPPPTPSPPSPPPLPPTTQPSGSTHPPTTQPSGPTHPPSTPRFPQMSLSDARSYVRTTLRHAFPRTFKHAHQYVAKCDRVSTIRFSCHVRYGSGLYVYYGSVAVYYVRMFRGTVYWSDSYDIRWVTDPCYFHSKHRNRCAIHHARGTV